MIASCRWPERLRKCSCFPAELSRAPRGHSHGRCADPPWAHNSDTARPLTRFAEQHCQWSRGLQALHTLVMAGLPSRAPHPRGWAWPARVHRHQLYGEFSPSSPRCLPSVGPLSIPSTSAESLPSAGQPVGSRGLGRRPSFLVPDSIPQLCDSQLSAPCGCSPDPVPSSHIICWPFLIPLRSHSVSVFSRHSISLPLETWFGIFALRAIPKLFPSWTPFIHCPQ